MWDYGRRSSKTAAKNASSSYRIHEAGLIVDPDPVKPFPGQRILVRDEEGCARAVGIDQLRPGWREMTGKLHSVDPVGNALPADLGMAAGSAISSRSSMNRGKCVRCSCDLGGPGESTLTDT